MTWCRNCGRRLVRCAAQPCNVAGWVHEDTRKHLCGTGNLRAMEGHRLPLNVSADVTHRVAASAEVYGWRGHG